MKNYIFPYPLRKIGNNRATDHNGHEVRFLDVTEADIKNGVPRNPEKCAIALGLNRTFPECSPCRIIGDRIEYANDEFKGDRPTTMAPSVTGWVERFDRGESVEPFKCLTLTYGPSCGPGTRGNIRTRS